MHSCSARFHYPAVQAASQGLQDQVYRDKHMQNHHKANFLLTCAALKSYSHSWEFGQLNTRLNTECLTTSTRLSFQHLMYAVQWSHSHKASMCLIVETSRLIVFIKVTLTQ